MAKKRKRPAPHDFFTTKGPMTIKKGEVNHLMIAHDDWCNHFKVSGECNCHPVVEMVNAEEFLKRSQK